MLVLLARYAFIFCLIFNANNCDKELLRSWERTDLESFKLSACVAHCLQQLPFTNEHTNTGIADGAAATVVPATANGAGAELSEKSPLKSCLDICRSQTQTKELKKIHENLTLKLVCRDDTSLTFRIDLEQTNRRMGTHLINNEKVSEKLQNGEKQHKQMTEEKFKSMLWLTDERKANALNNTVYFIRMHEEKADHSFVYLSDDNFITLDNLRYNTAHDITAVAINANYEYSVISKSEQHRTLNRGYIPGEVRDIKLLGFQDDEFNENRLKARITWKPAADMTCHYSILCYADSDGSDLITIELRNPRQLFAYDLENLTHSSKYEMGIRSKNTKNASRESDFSWTVFTVPSCVTWHNYNFNVCAPLHPHDLRAEPTFIEEFEYSLNISWAQPDHYPSYYTLRILELSQNGSSFVTNVSKTATSFFVEKITLKGGVCDVHLTAYTPGGNSTTSIYSVANQNLRLDFSAQENIHIVKLLSAILAPLLCISIFSLTIFIVHRRAKLKRYQERCKYFEELEKKAPIDPKATFEFPTKTLTLLNSTKDLTQFQLDLEEKIFFNDDAMEIDRNNLTLHEVLGEGAFGLVRRGIYKDVKSVTGVEREVAVKMLKDQPSIDDIRAFSREIEVMKSVLKHPNIVGIIGHCTKRINEMMLLTEYCSFGNLLEFLRDEWKYLHELALQNAKQKLLVENEKNTQICLNYKNLSKSLQTLEYNTKYSNDDEEQHIEEITETDKLSAENKSYGYDQICTSFCKCQVNVTIKNLEADDANKEAEQLEQLLQQKQNPANVADDAMTAPTTNTMKSIEVQNCNCQKMLQQQNKRNGITLPLHFKVVENEQYFKHNIDATTATTTAKIKNGSRSEEQQNKLNCLLSSAAIREPLSASDLLDIAKQVAVGMEFLAKNKVVHRDLAARNILVSPDRTVKIADFGLSRDIYQDNMYKKTGNGKLPIKWLALESLTHQVYTTQSDVWSFGILLYEIVTLGSTPYPSIPTSRLLHLLKSGYRMEKPRNCGQAFYNLMHSCWHGNPSERPNFTEIIKILDTFLMNTPDQHISSAVDTRPIRKYSSIEENLSPRTEKAAMSKSNSDENYLKPL